MFNLHCTLYMYSMRSHTASIPIMGVHKSTRPIYFSIVGVHTLISLYYLGVKAIVEGECTQ